MLDAGIELDPSQQDVLRDGMGTAEDGSWVADDIVILQPRQNGKTVALVARGLWGVTLGGEKLVLWSAHQFKTAREAFLLAKSLCETPALKQFGPKVTAAHGWEGITFRDGGRLQFIARSRVSGRGFSPDVVIADEAFELDDLALAALKPSLAAAKSPQLWFASSAPHDTSTVLRRLALRGREGEAKRLVYLEWCADEGATASDVQAWRQANPGLGHRISLEHVASELEAMDPEDFGRERLGTWNAEATAGVFPDWAALLDTNPPRPSGSRALGIDVTPDRRRACIAAAANVGEGRVLVEILADRDGVAWVVDEVAALAAEHSPDVVVIDRAGQARTLIGPLEKAGVSLVTTDFPSMVAACGAFYDAVTEGRLVHRGDPSLEAAVAGAAQRHIGDAWVWARRSSRSNVSPLVAATLAVWGVGQTQTSMPGIIGIDLDSDDVLLDSDQGWRPVLD